jgi:hypothetical protein
MLPPESVLDHKRLNIWLAGQRNTPERDIQYIKNKPQE